MDYNNEERFPAANELIEFISGTLIEEAPQDGVTKRREAGSNNKG